MSTQPTLPPIPKFAQIGPDSTSDWQAFYRWLTQTVNFLQNLISQLTTLIAQVTPGWVIDVIVSNVVTPDLSKGQIHIITLNQPAQITIAAPINVGSLLTGSLVVFFVVQDAIGSRPTPILDPIFIGAANWSMAPDPASYSTLVFRLGANDKFYLVNDIMNGAGWAA